MRTEKWNRIGPAKSGEIQRGTNRLRYWLVLALVLAGVTMAPAQPLVPNNAVWSYLDNGSDQGIDWIDPDFLDSSWLTGPAELGFGDGGEATTNMAGFVTYYYRHAFNVVDAGSITNLRARMLRDDGIVVYLNGFEVFRDNLPAGPITATNLALVAVADDGMIPIYSRIDASRLRSGRNVLAVEIHQQSTASSDISFALELTGNPTPLISITSPTNSQTVRGTTVNISGVATPAGQSVTLVEAFAGLSKVGESTNGNFNIEWSGVPPGVYTLRTKVTDSAGLIATSAPVNITVEALPASVLIPRRSTGWRYQNLNQDLFSLEPTWPQVGYSDAGWGGPSQGPLGENPDAPVGDTINTPINTGPASAKFPVIFYRRNFQISGAAAYQGLIVRLQCDDYAVVFINGQQVVNDGVPEPLTFNFTGGAATGTETDYAEFTVPASVLREGNNVVAVANYQQAATSSDLQFDLELEGIIDTTPPVVIAIDPPTGSIRQELSSINVIFDDSVVGVNASDLLIDNEQATGVITNNPRDYTFTFPQPPTGQVQVAFALNHGITDTSPLANAFGGMNWTYTLDPNVSALPNVILSEFVADNNSGIRDDDGQRNDWLELLNLGPLDANLEGWFLTDSPTNLTKWRIPAVALRANNYVLIWCSSKNHTNLNSPLHTNFRLQREAGGYVALVGPRTNVVSAFSNYVAQLSDVAFGRDRVDPSLSGYLTPPTPGAQNSLSGPAFMGPPVASTNGGVYTAASLSLTLSNTNGSGTIRYTTDGTLPSGSSTLYSTSLVLSANSTIKARIFPPAGTNLLPSDVVARNFIFLDGTSSSFSSKLPTMIISTEGRAIPQDLPPGSTNRAKGSIVVIDTDHGRSSIQGPSQVHQQAVFEHFGQTSAGFPKRPIRVEIQDRLENDLDVGILGMPADSDWRLRNPYNDKTVMNDFLGFELWEKMGHYSVRRRLVDVFLDTGGGRVAYPGDYYGVMVLCETIKVNKDRVDIPDITPYKTNLLVTDGGFIFKRDKASTGDLNFTSPGGSGFSGIPLRLHEPKVQSLRKVPLTAGESSFPGPGYTTSGTNQMNYLRNFLGTMESALYAANWTTRTGTNHYSYYLDPVAFADQMLHVEITKQIDGYRLSDYFNKGNDGRIGPGPVWDWNLAFGNADYLAGGQTNGWYYEAAGEQDHPWARRLITGTTGGTSSSGDPDFTQLVADRWSVFRTNVLNGTNLLFRIEELANLLSESAARDLYGKYRNGLIGVYTWPNPGNNAVDHVDYVHPTNYLGVIETRYPAGPTNSIIGQMKKWMLGRYLWMDSQFTLKPTFNQVAGMVSPGTQVTLVPPAGAILYYTVDGRDPRVSGGGVLVGASSNSGPVNVTINANTRIFARAKSALAWKSTWSGPNVATYFINVPPLRITEVMYHPPNSPPGMLVDADEFEYVEVKNISGANLNVTGYSLAGGIQFTFGSLTLIGGQSAVVVKNLAAFQSRYGTNNPNILIAGVYSGGLANDSDHIILYDNYFVPIHDFTYEDGWHRATDGLGFALVTANENAPPGNLASASGWQPGTVSGGSPGTGDPSGPARPPVVINEVLASGDTNLTPGLLDFIEIHNPTGSPADISGWFLTDDLDTPIKYVIPNPTVIQPGQFVVISESAYNASPGSSNSFGLSSDGDEVYLFSGDGVQLTGYSHGFDFGAAAHGVTVGRYTTSTGGSQYVAQKSRTSGMTNAGPLVGPLVVSEINYRPFDIAAGGVGFDNTEDEYLELQNIASTNLALFDPTRPTNTWRLRDAVDYDFPTNVTILPGRYLIVVSFNPATNASATAAFRARNFIPAEVPLYGPWDGQLSNEGESIEIRRPGTPGTNGTVPYILNERVSYLDNNTPWPFGASGTGLTLQRRVHPAFGNDGTNWTAVAPSPGTNYSSGGTAPMITSQPMNQTIVIGQDVLLTVTATGTAPLRYQWFLNGLQVSGANTSTLFLTNVQPANGGVYTILVYNSADSVLSTPFTLSTRVGLRITAQPTNMFFRPGNTASNRVVAVGTGTLRYQWGRNGSSLPNATNSTLFITNVQASAEGSYNVQVSDDVESTTSISVPLTLIFPPVVTLQPIPTTALLGGNAQFSIMSTGTAPMSFRWRQAGVTYTSGNRIEFSGAPGVPASSILVLTNVTLADATNYTCVVSNVGGNATVSPPAATPASLTVLTDMDGDGLPDVWEMTHPGFDKNNPADGAADTDHDGMSNKAEYIAGTDYLDNQSYLKVELPSVGPATLQFIAVSNRTYTVQFSDNLASWLRLVDVLARTNSRTEIVIDPTPVPARSYRLVTPSQP
jgi:hypothetical protein